ncbi:hypothetical protein PSQ19_00420 [Devosia algicola]|uniref:Uncharacterized protein n=1 Tax=Devosia algicola TaxID=3026418 RepID=A0ABY7YNL3_9HYPH|nr:hypothetical protein [Devosia algicola]WDR02743.1 hypothetical protein PSQ19_00420 [Devosia algicola]
MSVSDLSPTSNDLFWGRVRAALGGLRITRTPERERTPAYGKAAIARSLGMKPRLSAEDRSGNCRGLDGFGGDQCFNVPDGYRSRPV